MIELYSGTPGSGKSLHTASKIRQWINVFRSPVICNFQINLNLVRLSKWGSFTYVDNAELCPELLIDFSESYRIARGLDHVSEETILLIIDECQLIFNNREWAKPGRAAWTSFFTQHRKLGYRIILVAQFREMLDKQVRSLIEYEYLHRKVKNAGKMGVILNALAGGGLHVAIKLYAPMRSMQVGTDFFKYDKYLAAMYNSYGTFSAGAEIGTGSTPPATRLHVSADVAGASVASAETT